MCRAHAGDIGGGPAVNTGREVLPASVVPQHYDITLEPDFKKLTFEGTVVIDLDCVEESKSISVNTLELEIHSVKVRANEKVVR
jgi:aminopeptidase 2